MKLIPKQQQFFSLKNKLYYVVILFAVVAMITYSGCKTPYMPHFVTPSPTDTTAGPSLVLPYYYVPKATVDNWLSGKDKNVLIFTAHNLKLSHYLDTTSSLFTYNSSSLQSPPDKLTYANGLIPSDEHSGELKYTSFVVNNMVLKVGTLRNALNSLSYTSATDQLVFQPLVVVDANNVYYLSYAIYLYKSNKVVFFKRLNKTGSCSVPLRIPLSHPNVPGVPVVTLNPAPPAKP